MRYRNRNRIERQSYFVSKHTGGNYRSLGEAQASARDFEEHNVDQLIIDEMSDSVTPGYFKKKKKGELLPTSPLKVNRQERQVGYINLSATRQVTNNIWNAKLFSHYGYPSVSSVQPNLLSNHDIQTIAQSAQARMASDGIDWATSALELGKTISMITGLRRSIQNLIARILNSLRDRRFKSFAELYTAFSSAWLEGRFGWRILYYEIKSIYDYLETIGEDHKKFFSRETLHANKTEKSSGIVTNKNGTLVTWDQEVTYNATATVGYVGVGDLSKPGGFNALNTAWEVIPFTVVLDMFFNIQDIILAWAPHASRVNGFQAGSFLSVKQQMVAVRTYDGSFTDPRDTVISVSVPSLATNTVITRNAAPEHPFSFDFSAELRGLKKVDLLAFMGPLYKAFIK